MKKLLITIFSLIIFTHAALAQDIFRVTSVNFDTSNSLIFLTSPDNTTEAIMKNVKMISLQKPKRVYFDINSAVLTAAPQNWFLNSGGVTQVKISQFSTTPAKIRVVFYLNEDFEQSKISFLKVNNNLVIKFKDTIGKEEYFQNTYRDEKSSSSDFYENLSISSEDTDKLKTAVNSPAKDEVLNQIQQSFSSTTATISDIKSVSSRTTEVIKKELKLKSKYYLNSIYPNSNGFLISGFGVVGIEKPMYLTNPARVVFDLPNTILGSEIKDKEFKLNEDTIKVGQFESNKTRVVITSNQLEKYFPIFSADGQSALFVKSEAVDNSSLFTKTTDAISYEIKKTNPLTDEFIIAFNSPIIHSIKRDSSKLTINLYNALRYNDDTFKNTIKDSSLNGMTIDLLPQVGLKLSLPLEKDNVINCYLGADGKSIKIVAKGTNPRKNECTIGEKKIILPKCNGKKVVVIDAGHGGSDYGAIRAGINEKDINLDLARRIQALLMNNGVVVYMERDKDEFVSLQDRTTFSANKSPDIFVSMHVNSSVRPEIIGIETHYYHQESLELAQTVHASLVSSVKSKDRGLFKSKFYVINHTDVPAILVEIGFISNDAERAELVSEQRKRQTAKAVTEGILKYLNKK
ncbi:MAG: N-acetylmuramoyl-L-alanine amidase [bacterium]